MKVTTTKTLQASPEAVWQIIGEGFGDLAWVRSVTTSHLEGELEVGSVRVCRFEPMLLAGEGARERLEVFDRDTRRLAYRLEDPTGMLARAGSQWHVEAEPGGGARVTVTSTLQLRPWAFLFTPVLRRFVRRLTIRTFEDLSARLQLSGERTLQPQHRRETAARP